MSATINFFTQDVSRVALNKKRALKAFIPRLVQDENKTPGVISIIFCSDEFLLGMNREYLKHDYYTDIITFDYTEKKMVSGDLFISIDRVKSNAKTHSTSFENELIRVIFHGILHLCGYGDKTPKQVRKMRSKEDEYLKKFLQ